MIEQILPPEVAVVETFQDPLEATLFPEEEAVIGSAVGKRRREFATARMCARRALAELGRPPAPVLRGEHGEPQWPTGVVGSMTHCAGYRAAALAHATDMATVGIDAEPHNALPNGVLEAVSLPEERIWIAEQATDGGQIHWDRVLFSAKESVYKAWFPLTKKWLGFEEALITIHMQPDHFFARLLVPGPLLDGEHITGFSGRWLVHDGLVATAIAVPRVTRQNE